MPRYSPHKGRPQKRSEGEAQMKPGLKLPTKVTTGNTVNDWREFFAGRPKGWRQIYAAKQRETR